MFQHIRLLLCIALVSMVAACGGGQSKVATPSALSTFEAINASSATPVIGETSTFQLKGSNLASAYLISVIDADTKLADCANLSIIGRNSNTIVFTCKPQVTKPTLELFSSELKLLQTTTGTALPPTKITLTSVEAALDGDIEPQYNSSGTFYISGQFFTRPANPTSSDCLDLEVTSVTDRLITLTCTPTSSTAAFEVKTIDGELVGTVTAIVSNPLVELTWRQGGQSKRVFIQLALDSAPITTKNFLRYVDAKFYDGTLFHRVISGFMSQGGGYKSVDLLNQTLVPQDGPADNAGALYNPIALENTQTTSLNHIKGTIAMARTAAPDSATSQFFINAADNRTTLNYVSADQPGYAVFGSVIATTQARLDEAIELLATLNETPGQTVGSNENVPIDDVVIQSIRQVRLSVLQAADAAASD
jgi:peptidyl-prolyl cis-trans isomerase A (cyclophilin A)